MNHNMKLSRGAFCKIADSSKTIELRLNDEKRQKIAVGDTIIFTCVDNRDIITSKVKALHKFIDFKVLYESLPLVECGYTSEQLNTASYADMYEYYTEEQIKKYGALGIELCNVEAICDSKPDLLSGHIYSLLMPSVYEATEQKLRARAQKYFDSLNTYVYTFLEDGEYMGIVVFSKSESVATICDIAVKYQHTGKGIGRKMIEYILNCFNVCSIVAETDDDAVDFYKKCGFDVANTESEFDIKRYICTLTK